MEAVVAKCPDLSAADRLTLFAIFLVYPDRYPSASILGKKVGLHAKTVGKCLETLRSVGLIDGKSKKRIGIGFIREIDMSPVIGIFLESKKHAGELIVADEPLRIKDIPSEVSDENFAAQHGPAGATAEEAAKVRSIMSSLGSPKDWEDVVAIDRKESMELALRAPDVERALRVFPAMTPDILDAMPLASQGPPPAPAVAVPEDPEDELQEVSFAGKDSRVTRLAQMPDVRTAPAVLSFAALDEAAQKFFREGTLTHSIALCLPLWAETETMAEYERLIAAAYAQPASSHQEVWDRVTRSFRAYLRRRAQEMGYKWMDEQGAFTRAYNAYYQDCQIDGKEAIDMDEFRERFYRHQQFQEYRQ
jgi:hypothetical protein